jgi:transposase
MPKFSRLEVITTRSRRRWTPEVKLRIVAESYSGHRVVSSTARRHGLASSQLFAWRKLARAGRLSGMDKPGFAAATLSWRRITAALERSTCSAGAGRMEIIIDDVRILVGASVNGAALARVVDVIGRR